MANTYSAPNFNIDTDVNVAGLTALKGSASAVTDYIYVVAGATLTVEGALSCMQIVLGETSGGAAGAGEKIGHVIFDDGVTVTFGGNATYTNSGIKANPASAGTESKGNSITLNGTSTSKITFTNDGDTYDTNKFWTIAGPYLNLAGQYLNGKHFGPKLLVTIAQIDSFISGSSQQLNHVETYNAYASYYGIGFRGYSDGNIPCQFRFWVMDNQVSCTMLNVGSIRPLDGTNPVIDWSGLASKDADSWLDQFTILDGIRNHGTDLGPFYVGSGKMATIDIRSTETTPTTFAATDGASNGDLVFTWNNGVSYRSVVNGDAVDDFVFIYDNADNSLVTCVLARSGTVEVGGFTNEVAKTFYAKASTDGYVFSDATATDSVTPTSVTDFPAIADVRDGVTFNNGVLEGTYAIGRNRRMSPQDSVALQDSATDLYVCPANTRASVLVYFHNIDSTARTYTVQHLPSGGSAAAADTTKSLAIAGAAGNPGRAYVFQLDPGDKVQGLASVVDKVYAHLSVIEEIKS